MNTAVKRYEHARDLRKAREKLEQPANNGAARKTTHCIASPKLHIIMNTYTNLKQEAKVLFFLTKAILTRPSHS